MAITDPDPDSSAAQSLALMLEKAGEDFPVPDAFNARSGEVANQRTLSLAQKQQVLAVNHHHVRAMVAESGWYA